MTVRTCDFSVRLAADVTALRGLTDYDSGLLRSPPQRKSSDSFMPSPWGRRDASNPRRNCANCDTRTLPLNEHYQCRSSACHHGRVLRESGTQNARNTSPSYFTLNDAPGALYPLLIGGFAVAGVTFLLATFWFAAVAGTLIVTAGCLLVKMVGGNLLWDLKATAVQSATTINGYPNCENQAQEISRPSQRRVRTDLDDSQPEWNDPTLT